MANSNRRNSYILIICGLLLLSLGIFLSVSIGAKDIDFSTMINSLFGQGNDINSKIIRDVRIPRALAGVLVGGFLAVSGAIMQGITRNPIAEPSVIGITQGATFMVAIALVLQQVNSNISKELNKIIKDKDVKKDIDSYKDDISKLLSSSKFNKDVILMYGYESSHKQVWETYEPSSILYTYGKDVTKDYMFMNGETVENDRGQKLYYNLKLTKPLYLKIYENTRVSAIVATPIFFIIYVVLKIAFRKKKVKF